MMRADNDQVDTVFFGKTGDAQSGLSLHHFRRDIRCTRGHRIEFLFDALGEVVDGFQIHEFGDEAGHIFKHGQQGDASTGIQQMASQLDLLGYNGFMVERDRYQNVLVQDDLLSLGSGG